MKSQSVGVTQTIQDVIYIDPRDRETILNTRLEKYGKLPRKQKKELKKYPEKIIIMDEFHSLWNRATLASEEIQSADL